MSRIDTAMRVALALMSVLSFILGQPVEALLAIVLVELIEIRTQLAHRKGK